MNAKTVYHYGKNKFGFRPIREASVAGRFEQREYDERIDWHWRPSPGLGAKPSQKWLYWNIPK